MKNKTTLRESVHCPEHVWLRNYLIKRRKELGLSQKDLAERMGVIASFVGKIETGDRRLDILEFVFYCYGLEVNPVTVIELMLNENSSIA